ncbi:DEAD/DEAH box helicase [Ferrimonas sp. SCSIO 43195]|uniref:DEAD/DEAH box helicase n=1 Tax=Ferrimonas sp. SCSIO 43195 TaxID=2822844 RepID=UPI002075D62E|nr:DEAD/DEAH box helicase [Ferrimonas sp. SCSIO 43195]USD36484.1 DEAD/DEAH box helicase [Ferrimonas sp. SCSIO 43195]
MLLFRLTDVENNFDDATFNRGKRYFEEEMVLQAELGPGGNSVHGTTLGRRDNQYDTSIEIKKRGDRCTLESFCNCPVSSQCKHAVALLLTILDQHHGHQDRYQAWLEKFSAVHPPKPQPAPPESPLVGRFRVAPSLTRNASVGESIVVEVGNCRRLKRGGFSKFTAKQLFNVAAHYGDGWANDDVVTYSRLLLATRGNTWYRYAHLETDLDRYTYQKLLDQQLAFWDQPNQTLTQGPVQTLNFRWEHHTDYQLHSQLQCGAPWVLVPFSQPWYINLDDFSSGPLETELSTEVLFCLQRLPALPREQARHFGDTIALQFNEHTLPHPIQTEYQQIEAPLTPVLKLVPSDEGIQSFFWLQYDQLPLPKEVTQRPTQTRFSNDHGHWQIQRDSEAEQAAVELYQQLQLSEFEHGGELAPQVASAAYLKLATAATDLSFWQKLLSQFQGPMNQQQWQLQIDPSLPLLPHEIPAFDLIIEEDDSWFNLGLSVEIDDQQVELLPLLLTWLDHNSDWRGDNNPILLHRDGAMPLRIANRSIRPVLAILEELANPSGDRIRLPSHQAGLLEQLPRQGRWIGGERIQQLAHKLNHFSGIETVEPPENLHATLRPYQQQGLDWLAFLHQYGFGGVLADDMGLGKTLQTLAHLQRLKQRDQLPHPALLVCPTSLISNWRSESQRFCPDLSVLVLHGQERHRHFDTLGEFDLIITTYGLVGRDIELFASLNFSLAILDEAQAIKTPGAKITKAVKQLNAGQRLCLTGTPMENHLGELWSLFDFVMPSFLGSEGQFSRYYRKPIEKEGNLDLKKELLTRLAPFLLRRTKSEVAQELPAKTEMVQTIPLPPQQRILYEGVRVAMEARVRELLSRKGMAKSQIEFLDALLKLRQICCDPQLVKLEQAALVQESAKLDFLMEMLPPMLEEGRRVLIFSQFTQMLALIEARLEQQGIPFAKLTGQTRKREQAIDSFQNGEVPVFLISLKAGGVGLNLTAADTVIHYDPWWNPAAENQATDRAYRIGQDKPVFVYKLICEQTIEERVMELQQQKQALADSIYDKDAQDLGSSLTGDQLLSLFDTPLPQPE